MKIESELTTIVIADDHEIFRDGLKLMLTPKNGVRVVGEADNGRKLVSLVRELEPQVVITDVQMPEMDGVEAARHIMVNNKNTNIITLSMFDEEQMVVDMFEVGALGYLLKNTDKKELLEAIESVKNGNPYFCASATKRLTRLLGISQCNPFKKTEEATFTDREKELIALVCQELTNKEIGEKMNISIRTVEGTRQRVIEKMKVKNTVGMVLYAMKMGLYEAKN